MCVVVGGASSSVRSVSSGVPQGSVLGPILFLVYANYLTNSLACKHGSFSDDYKIYLNYNRVAGQDGRAALQRDLDSMVAVVGSWNLSLNNSNCVILQFGRHFSCWDNLENGFQYKIGNSVLEIVTCHKDLGVVIETGLKFHCHVRELVCKVAGLSSSLLRATVNRSPEFMITQLLWIIVQFCEMLDMLVIRLC